MQSDMILLSKKDRCLCISMMHFANCKVRNHFGGKDEPRKTVNEDILVICEATDMNFL